MARISDGGRDGMVFECEQEGLEEVVWSNGKQGMAGKVMEIEVGLFH